MEIVNLPLNKLTNYKNNARKHTDEDVNTIINSIKEFGFNDPIGIWSDKNIIVEGHGRALAAKKLKMEEVPCIRLDHLTDEQRKAYALAHNKTAEMSDWNYDLLTSELQGISEIDMKEFGFTEEEITSPRTKYKNLVSGVLQSKFVAPPFSVLDSRQGYWKDRKAEWHKNLPDSRDGREDGLLGNGLKYLARAGGSTYLSATSEFDPVLCEVIYQWFAPAGGLVIDPFAGGHIRGTIADILGLHYKGIELRPEQVDTNNGIKEKYGIEKAEWICDDSLNVDKYIKDESADFIIACPPYADLEVYSDDPRDISNMDYPHFLKTYEKIIAKFIKKLKTGSFAVFVVGDARGKDGFYYDFISDTKKAFIKNGMGLYNECILIESMANAALRASGTFGASRKVIKGHQNILVFYKGPQIEQKKHVLVFYKGNPKDIMEYEPGEDIFSPTKDKETKAAVKEVMDAANKTDDFELED